TVEQELELNEPSANTDRDCLCAIVRAEFFHDVLKMSFDRFFCNKKRVSNVPIALSPGELTKNFHFTPGKPFLAIVFRQVSCNFGRNAFLPCVDLPNYFRQFMRRHCLQHVPASSSFQCSLNFCIT